MELEKIHLQRESSGWAASLPSGPCAGCLAELCPCELGANPQASLEKLAHTQGLLCARHGDKCFLFIIL